MSVPEFDSLYYTDCVPGQGLRGGAGFQFQAVSDGVSHEVMSLVQRTSLYEAPVAWMREQREVARYPASLSHFCDGAIYTTARGRYLGAEANGVREGNQFTHAIATADPETYGLTRPAQLWDAAWWVEQVAPTTTCDRLPAEPETGRWGIDAVREWVLGRPDGEEWLLAVHSAMDQVHETGGKRLLFVGTDPADIVGWIAAGTLLLPQTRALRIGFRVFATNPRQSRHEVLAVHDEWAGALANTERDQDFVVFNLTTGRHSVVRTTDSARYWVPRFLRGDPYDAIDAIELAQRLSGEERAAAIDRFAAAVAVLDEEVRSRAEAAELVAWLRSRPDAVPEDVLEPIVEGLLGNALDVPLLRDLRAVMERYHTLEDLTGRVVRALFAAELAQLTDSAVDDADQLPLLGLAERAAAVVRPDRMPALLELAAAFDVRPRIGTFAGNAKQFVRWWVANPAARADPARWSCHAEMTALLRQELEARLAGPDSQVFQDAVRKHWWPFLWPSVSDVRPDLDATVLAAARAEGTAEVQRRTFELVLSTSPDLEASRRGPLMWRALFSYVLPTFPELFAVLRELPRGSLQGWFADRVGEALDELIGAYPTAAELDLLRVVERLGTVPGSPYLADLAKADADLERWLRAVAERRPVRHTLFRRMPAAVLEARREEIVKACLEDLAPTEAVRLADQPGSALPRVLLRELPRWWSPMSTNDSPGRAIVAVAVAFVAAHAPGCPDEDVDRVERSLRKWQRSQAKDASRQVGDLLQRANRGAFQEWREFAGSRTARTTGQTERAKRIWRPADEKSGGLFGRRKDR